MSSQPGQACALLVSLMFARQRIHLSLFCLLLKAATPALPPIEAPAAGATVVELEDEEGEALVEPPPPAFALALDFFPMVKFWVSGYSIVGAVIAWCARRDPDFCHRAAPGLE